MPSIGGCLNLRGKYWRQFCDDIVSENIRIRPSTRIRNVIEFKNFHSGERIKKFPDLLANSPYACGRLPYPERKSCGLKNIRIRVDGAKISIAMTC